MHILYVWEIRGYSRNKTTSRPLIVTADCGSVDTHMYIYHIYRQVTVFTNF